MRMSGVGPQAEWSGLTKEAAGDAARESVLTGVSKHGLPTTIDGYQKLLKEHVGAYRVAAQATGGAPRQTLGQFGAALHANAVLVMAAAEQAAFLIAPRGPDRCDSPTSADAMIDGKIASDIKMKVLEAKVLLAKA